MKSTIMEYGLTMIALILVVFFLNGFLELFGDGGSIRDTLIDYVNDIC